MSPILSICIVVVVMEVLLLTIIYLLKIYINSILKKCNIEKDSSAHILKDKIIAGVNITIILAGLIAIIISVTNYNPAVGTNSSVVIEAPLPAGFEAPTNEEIKNNNNKLTEVETKREKTRREVEERQIKLENEAIKKGKQ